MLAESEQVFGPNASLTGALPSAEELRGLQFTEACLRETLRKYRYFEVACFTIALLWGRYCACAGSRLMTGPSSVFTFNFDRKGGLVPDDATSLAEKNTQLARLLSPGRDVADTYVEFFLRCSCPPVAAHVLRGSFCCFLFR